MILFMLKVKQEEANPSLLSKGNHSQPECKTPWMATTDWLIYNAIEITWLFFF